MALINFILKLFSSQKKTILLRALKNYGHLFFINKSYDQEIQTLLYQKQFVLILF